MAFLQGELPPLDISPVHVQITIFKSGEVYKAYVYADSDDGIPKEITIDLKPGDVKNLNIVLKNAIQQVATTYGKGAAYESALAELARQGNYAFTRIFQDESDQETIRDALQPGTIVQIVSKDFFIPWELLYDGPLGANAHISYYWGMQYIISRLIMQNVRKGAFAHPVLASTRPHVGLIAYDKLPYVEQNEIPTLKRLHDMKLIELDHLRNLSKLQRDVDLTELKHFLAQELHVIHFACHAYELDPIDLSYLFVSEDFALSMIDCSTSQFEMIHNPFIFLNACLTGLVNPLYTSSWAGKFWELGARGVLAADFSVPDWFGAAFSDVLYQYLLAGLPIGEALIKARQQFWTDQNPHNPLGLAYALYSSPSIKIAKARKKSKEEQYGQKEDDRTANKSRHS